MTKQMVTPATRVFMVRHGATVVSAEDRFAGATDVELSDEGRSKHDAWHSVYAGRKSLRSMPRHSDARLRRRKSWLSRPSSKCRRATAFGKFPTAAGNR